MRWNVTVRVASSATTPRVRRHAAGRETQAGPTTSVEKKDVPGDPTRKSRVIDRTKSLARTGRPVGVAQPGPELEHVRPAVVHGLREPQREIWHELTLERNHPREDA